MKRRQMLRCYWPLIIFMANTKVSFGQCEFKMSIWYDSEGCGISSEPDVTTIINADGACNIDTTDDGPGMYIAQCEEDSVRFISSGCKTEDCSRQNGNPIRGSSQSCQRDRSGTAFLYSAQNMAFPLNECQTIFRDDLPVISIFIDEDPGSDNIIFPTTTVTSEVPTPSPNSKADEDEFITITSSDIPASSTPTDLPVQSLLTFVPTLPVSKPSSTPLVTPAPSSIPVATPSQSEIPSASPSSKEPSNIDHDEFTTITPSTDVPINSIIQTSPPTFEQTEPLITPSTSVPAASPPSPIPSTTPVPESPSLTPSVVVTPSTSKPTVVPTTTTTTSSPTTATSLPQSTFAPTATMTCQTVIAQDRCQTLMARYGIDQECECYTFCGNNFVGCNTFEDGNDMFRAPDTCPSYNEITAGCTGSDLRTNPTPSPTEKDSGAASTLDMQTVYSTLLHTLVSTIITTMIYNI